MKDLEQLTEENRKLRSIILNLDKQMKTEKAEHDKKLVNIGRKVREYDLKLADYESSQNTIKELNVQIDFLQKEYDDLLLKYQMLHAAHISLSKTVSGRKSDFSKRAEIISQIIDLQASGYSGSDIYDRLNISRATYYRYLKNIQCMEVR